MNIRLWLASLLFAFAAAKSANAQIYPPGQFAIDGIPVFCGNLPTVVTPNIPDAAMNNGQAILLNPMVLGRLPTVLKLYVYAHECGHAVVGTDEVGADCWAIRTGRDQGWLPRFRSAILLCTARLRPRCSCFAAALPLTVGASCPSRFAGGQRTALGLPAASGQGRCAMHPGLGVPGE